MELNSPWFITIVGIVTSVVGAATYHTSLKLLTKFQDHFRKKDNDLNSKISNKVSKFNEKEEISIFVNRIRYKIMLNYQYLEYISIIFVIIVSAIIYFTQNVYALFVVSIIFVYLTSTKLIHIFKINNIERKYKQEIIDQLGINMFETNDHI